MAENYTPTNVTTFANDTTAVNTVTNNFAAISTAFTDVLSRSGVSPNQMQSTLDMNNNQIINLPSPATINSPARLVDVVTNPTIVIPSPGGPTIFGVTVVGTTSYTISATDTVLVLAAGGTVTITFPAIPTLGRIIQICNNNNTAVNSASANILPLGGSPQTGILSATAGKWAWLCWNGSDWVIIANN